MANPVELIESRFVECFPKTRTPIRTLGREAEFPMINSQGEAADIRLLWPVLLEQNPSMFKVHRDSATSQLITSLEGPDFTLASEVGIGTIEVILPPCRNLFEISELMDQALALILKATNKLSYRILGFGIQPKSNASVDLMLPKERYILLHQILGSKWLLFTTSASDQLQFSIQRDELLPLLNYANLITPLVVAFCGNSSVNSENDGYISKREGHKARHFGSRHGMVGRPYESVGDLLKQIMSQQCLILKKADSYYKVDTPFPEVLAKSDQPFEDFLMHDHYLWNSARARAHHGTIEVRPSCQPPWHEKMASVALILGLVEARAEILDFLNSQFGDKIYLVMEKYLNQVISEGLAATEPSNHFLETILSLCEEGLRKRGQGEEVFLAPLQSRRIQRKNPGQKALDIFRTRGWDEFINYLAIDKI